MVRMSVFEQGAVSSEVPVQCMTPSRKAAISSKRVTRKPRVGASRMLVTFEERISSEIDVAPAAEASEPADETGVVDFAVESEKVAGDSEFSAVKIIENVMVLEVKPGRRSTRSTP